MNEDKIKEAFVNVKKDISEMKEKINNNSLKLERIEGMIIGFLKSQSVSPVSVSQSLNKSHNKIETKIMKTIRRNKKGNVTEQIKKLIPLYSVIEIKNIIVDEKGLCSKASFYRYISSLIVSEEIETETNLRLN